MCTMCAIQPIQPDDCALTDGTSSQDLRALITEGVDAAADRSTTYRMSVGDTFSGSIGTAYDRDWVAITLEAGTTYEFAHNGVTLGDPLVRLYDSNGFALASNDDGGPGLNSLLTYTATTSGTYYVSAEAFRTTPGPTT